MKKENTVKAKRVIAALIVTAAMSLSSVAQNRSGYISSTGRTENATTTSLDRRTDSGNRSGYISSTGRSDTDTPTTNDGNGTLGSGNITAQLERETFTAIWDWIGGII